MDSLTPSISYSHFDKSREEQLNLAHLSLMMCFYLGLLDTAAKESGQWQCVLLKHSSIINVMVPSLNNNWEIYLQSTKTCIFRQKCSHMVQDILSRYIVKIRGKCLKSLRIKSVSKVEQQSINNDI